MTGIDDEKLARIGLLVPFRGLAPGALRNLFAHASVETHEKDAMLWRAGDDAGRFYVVLSGGVELFVTGQHAEESVIDVFGAGEPMGLAYIFDQATHNASARVIVKSQVISVPAESFRAFVAADQNLLFSMMGGLSTRLRFLVHQVTDLKLKTTGQRLGSFLLGLTQAQSGSVTVTLPYDKKLVARRLAMKPESLSRALSKLRELGVSSRGANISIGDVAALRDFCQDEDE